MSGDDLIVVLEGREVGRVVREPGGALSLTYDDTYVGDAAATPLSVSMPALDRRHGDAVVAPWLWGLLPDRSDVITRWARRFEVPPTPVGLLGTQVGLDCAGAVQFVRADGLEALAGRGGRTDWLSVEEMADRLRLLSEDATSWLGRGFTAQFSLGGAQPKLALVRNGDRWGEPHGSTPTTHILKPAIPGLAGHDLNEHLCLAASAHAGLIVARSQVLDFGDQRAIVVERFDRVAVTGSLVRIHQEDMCQALGVHPSRKYQVDGGPSAEDVLDLMHRVMPAAVARDAVVRFVDALAMNWVIAGTDAHAKNYSLLLSGSQVRFAPLYDIASALPYDTSKGYDLTMAMKLGGDDKLRSHRQSTWPKVARSARLDVDQVVTRVRELTQRLPDAFSTVAARDEIVAFGSDLPARLTDLVAARARLCSRILG